MRVAVVGGGIAGLAAAWELVSGPSPAEVTVFEPGPLGGRIQTEVFLGHPVDTGADAFIARVPDAVGLARELGMADELVAPAARKALILIGGRLRPLPDGLVLGAPAHLRPLLASGILSPAGVLRAGLDLVLPRTPWPADPSVAEVVRRRFGPQVAKRLVDPLIGGIHAGRTEDLSAQSVAPQLVRAARSHRSLLLGLRALPAPGEGPLFLAPRGGMGRLVARLVEALGERGVGFEAVAISHIRGEKGGAVVLDPVGAFDAAVVATPARVAAELLHESAPEAAADLRAIRTASVVLATLAYHRSALAPPDGVSGWLVARDPGRPRHQQDAAGSAGDRGNARGRQPGTGGSSGDQPGNGLLMTACSFGSAKWPHWSDPDTMVLRVSAGRAGDQRALAMADDDLIDRVQREVAAALATTAEPFDGRVSRWREAFPQYQPGHQARVERIESALRRRLPLVALAGCSLRGSGVPACIASGRRAARAITTPPSDT